MNYSVLMSVYYKEKPDNLRQSMESIWRQTVPTDDFVLVCDGPLGLDLNAVVSQMEETHQDILHVIRLPKNVGLGNALNEGLKHCKNDLVARMDSDDISRQNHCERQLKVFEDNLRVAICSGIVEEFTSSTDIIDSQRIPPEKHEEIMQFAKKRNPFNHPCVMYRKNEVVAVGGYQQIFLLEDYYLWVRMLINGAVGYNLQESLLWMRAGSDMYKRRGGWKYAKAQIRLFGFMRKSGFIGIKDYMLSCMVRTASSLAPNSLRKAVFNWKLRK